jgi:hypothetical protein
MRENITAYQKKQKGINVIKKIPSSTTESGVSACASFGGIEEVPSTTDSCVCVPVQLLGGGIRVSCVTPSVVRKGMRFWNMRAKVKVPTIYNGQG